MTKTKDLKDMEVSPFLTYPIEERNWLNTSVVRLRKKGYEFLIKEVEGKMIVVKTKDI